jgi:MFS family permease
MGFADEHGKVIKPSLQGGIVAIYYAGSLIGAFWAGDFSDKYGRMSSMPFSTRVLLRRTTDRRAVQESRVSG